MKMTTKQLRSLISETLKEHKLSPSLKNNKTIQSPMQNKNIDEIMHRLETTFESTLSLNLVVEHMDAHYDPQTREFDDDVYEQIRSSVTDARKHVSEQVRKILTQAWNSAHNNVVPNRKSKAA